MVFVCTSCTAFTQRVIFQWCCVQEVWTLMRAPETATATGTRSRRRTDATPAVKRLALQVCTTLQVFYLHLSRQHTVLLLWCFTSTENVRWRGKREIMYLLLCCLLQNDSYIRRAAMRANFNVLLIVTMSTNHNLFEEKGKLKRN